MFEKDNSYLYSLDLKSLSEMISNLKSGINQLNNLIKCQENKVRDLLFEEDSVFLEDNSENCVYSIEHNKLDSLKREKTSLNNYLKKCYIILEKRSK